MKLEYLDYEFAKKEGYIDEVKNYHITVKHAFTDFNEMKKTIDCDKLTVNRGDVFIYVDDLRKGHLYVYDGINTIFEAGILLEGR